MESEKNVNRICSLNCGECPAHTPGIFDPTTCQVLNSVIDAYDAQGAYWRHKMEMDREALSRMDELLSRETDIEKRLDTAEKKLKGRTQKTGQGCGSKHAESHADLRRKIPDNRR